MNGVLDYHWRTAYDRERRQGHQLDWENVPAPFKEYPGLPVIPFPEPAEPPPIAWPELLAATPAAGRRPDFAELSRLLLLTATLTGRASYPGGEIWFRSAASAGALYPTEIYLATAALPGLGAGIYHYQVDNPGLVCLRTGPPPAWLGPQGPALHFLFTVIFSRSTWKYRERAYRYHLLDSGHLEANLLLALKYSRLPFVCPAAFPESRVNELLAVDPVREVCLVQVTVPLPAPTTGSDSASLSPPAAPNLAAASRTASREPLCPLVNEIHAATAGRCRRPAPELGDWEHYGCRPVAGWQPLPAAASPRYRHAYPGVLGYRRSRRNFVRRPAMSAGELAGLLASLPEDPAVDGQPWFAVGMALNQVESYDAGFYLWQPARAALGRLRAGDFSGPLAAACLEQRWLAGAAVHLLLFTDLEELENRAGPAAYRRCLLAAGRLGQRLYLGATALGLGCCAVGAYYDREIPDLLGLPANAWSLYLLAVGPVKQGVDGGSR